jgi:hypothetical protein
MEYSNILRFGGFVNPAPEQYKVPEKMRLAIPGGQAIDENKA